MNLSQPYQTGRVLSRGMFCDKLNLFAGGLRGRSARRGAGRGGLGGHLEAPDYAFGGGVRHVPTLILNPNGEWRALRGMDEIRDFMRGERD